jgi:hypothetical protein
MKFVTCAQRDGNSPIQVKLIVPFSKQEIHTSSENLKICVAIENSISVWWLQKSG